jgi:hypothetical protein
MGTYMEIPVDTRQSSSGLAMLLANHKNNKGLKNANIGHNMAY